MKLTDAQKYLQRVRKKPAKSESCLQRALVKACRGYLYGTVQERFAAIPNGWGAAWASETGEAREREAKGRAIHGAKLKAEGAKNGMPDVVFWGPRGSVLWMELKNGTDGRVSDAQHVIHESLRADGHQVAVCRDIVEAIKAIIAFYRGKEARE